jgi:hypothetical protein
MHITVRLTISPGLALQKEHSFIFTIIFYDKFGRNIVGQRKRETDVRLLNIWIFCSKYTEVQKNGFNPSACSVHISYFSAV